MKWLWRSNKTAPSRATKMVEEASQLGRSRFLEQQLRAVTGLSRVEGAGDIHHNPEHMLAIELPFMWGWFHAYAELQGDWPTTPDQRATLHIIQYCIDHHGMGFDQARAEGASLDQMWNEAHPLFEALRKSGREAYHQPEKSTFANVITQISDFRREERS
jgi:hypothetical protein